MGKHSSQVQIITTKSFYISSLLFLVHPSQQTRHCLRCEAEVRRVTSGEWTAVDTADVGDGRVTDRSVVTLLLLTLMTVVTSEQQQIGEGVRGEGGRLGTRSKKLYLFRVGFWH